jgi:hypothetical protein
MNEIYALLTGVLLRIAIPVLLTGGLVYLLRRLDARWQAEARQKSLRKLSDDQRPCWEMKSCPIEQVSACPAPKYSEPCWQIFRQANGYLSEKCLDCEVFRSAPLPAHS